MKTLIMIFLGGGLGSITRFSINRYIMSWSGLHFPIGTILINIIACFTLGAIVGFADRQQSFSTETRFFLEVGFCGGFSTFSAFSYDIITLGQNHSTSSMLAYIALSLVLAVLAMLGGIYLGAMK